MLESIHSTQQCFQSNMPREGKNRKPFKFNIAWVIPGVRLDCRKWESHGFISSTKDCRKVIFHESNLAEFFFFFLHKHGVRFTDGENGSWLCNNGNFMWEQPAKKRKRSEGTFLLLQHVFTSWTSPLWLAELRQLIVGSGKGAEKGGKFSWVCQKDIVWNYLCKSKVKETDHCLLFCWDPLFSLVGDVTFLWEDQAPCSHFVLHSYSNIFSLSVISFYLFLIHLERR